MKYKSLLLIAIAIISCAFMPSPGDDPEKLSKTLDADNSLYTNVGNIALTVSNFGPYGSSLRNLTQPNHQPSCEYPLGSGVEHIFQGGLWVGGFTKTDSNSNTKKGPFVSTGAIDNSSGFGFSGYEFTNPKGSKIVQRSTLLDSRFYNPLAISHQDLIGDYSDTNLTFSNGTEILYHNPLGVAVHEENYAWNFPFADFFVIKNYTITNVSGKYLDSVYVGLWTDAVIRQTKAPSYSTTLNGAFYGHGGDGYDDSLKIAYAYDIDGDVPFTNSYVGFLYLGSTPTISDLFLIDNGLGGKDTLPATCFNSWQYKNTTDPNFFAPYDDAAGDISRYLKMQGYFGGTNRYNPYYNTPGPLFQKGINPANLKVPTGTGGRSELITHGYYRNIPPGASINVAFAVVCGKKFGTEETALDTRLQRTNLYNNADWALRAYFGNDKNRNGKIDPGEDIFGDGLIHRYILPAPPTIPVMKIVPEQNKATIYWDKRAEASIDPISGVKDFAGYRIYRTQSGFDLDNSQNIISSLVLLAQYDSAGSSGFNTGFKTVELETPMTFPNDTNKYYYKYEISNLLDGWQYLFSVSAFDKGDPVDNLEPLESSRMANMKSILPGTTPTDDPNVKLGVYPNPYYGNAIWDGNSERLRKIYFYNLPADCEITVYTLAGDVVKRLQHNQSNNGNNIRWFDQYKKGNVQQFTGGEHAWDLITDNDQAIATGLYLFTVKNNKNGDIKTGKFLIIK
jgi:hypothetical protein